MRLYFSVQHMLIERYLHVTMYVCLHAGALVSGKTSGAAATNSRVKGAAKLMNTKFTLPVRIKF